MIKHSTIDKLGAGASFLCFLHCLFLPVILVLLPLGNIAWLADEKYEIMFIVLSASVAILSIGYGFYKHRQGSVLFLLAFGLLTVAIAHHFHEHTSSGYLMALGGLGLVTGHYVNLRFCRTCTKCTH